MSSNNKPICVYHGSGLFWSFVVSHTGRAATGLQEHKYFHTGICVYLNYVNNSIEVQLGKKFIMWLIMKTLLFTPFNDVWAALCIFLSDFFLKLFFLKCSVCTVPWLYHAQTTQQQTPDFWVTGLLQLTDNINGLGGSCFPRAPGMRCRSPFLHWSNLLRSAGAPKHANLKFALRKIEWHFSLKGAVSLSIAAS